MKKWFLLSFVFSATSVFALLPPLYESAREIDAILQNDAFKGALPSGDMILEIRRTPTGGYVIITQHYRLEVDVLYKKQSMPGVADFDLRFHKAETLRPGAVN